MKEGDIVGIASALGKIKILENFQGNPIKKAIPSQPVIIIGFEEVPQIGEKFRVYSDFNSAKEYIEKKERKTGRGDVFVAESDKKILNLILKADVSGTLEAIEGVLKAIPQDKVIKKIKNSDQGVFPVSSRSLGQKGNGNSTRKNQ